MKIICILTSIFALIAGKRITRKWCNLLSIIGLLHTITVSFAALQLFDYYDSNPAVYLMISLGLLSFTVGFFFARGDRVFQYKKSDWMNTYEISDTYEINYPVFVICFFTLLYFTVQRLLGFAVLLASGLNLATIRLYYFNPEMAESALGTISFSKGATTTYFYLPCLFLLLIIATISLFHDIIKRRTKFYIFVIYSCVALYCLTSGGRNLIYTIGFMVLFCYAYFNKQELYTIIYEIRIERQISKKNRRRILYFAAIISVWLMLALSSMRSDSESSKSFIETLYQYFCGYIPYSSHFYENLKPEDYTNGWMFISCFTKPFTNLMKSFFHINFSETYNQACVLLEQFAEHVRISPSLRTNGYVSVFYCFYTDFGYVSVILESIFFGACCGITDAKNTYRPNARSIVYYLLWFYIVLWSIIRWYLLSVHIMLVFFLGFIMFKRRYI